MNHIFADDEEDFPGFEKSPSSETTKRDNSDAPVKPKKPKPDPIAPNGPVIRPDES
jgi:hypothetical protein